ncbi:MAG: fibronectin type III domain-containing protein [Candidatus Paceibacterota bacterium]
MKYIQKINIFVILISLILGNGILPFSDISVLAAGATPTVTTASASGVSTSGATVNGQVNANGAPTSYWFEYGTSQSLGSHTSVQAGGDATSASAVSASLSGLTAGTTYYFRAVAQNQYGKGEGSIVSFTTVSNESTGGTPTSNPTSTGSPAGTSSGRTAVLSNPIFNNDPQDYASLRVSNYTNNPGTPTWSNQTDVKAGDVVSYSLYYHNTSGTTALNTRMNLSFNVDPISGKIQATSKLWADNAASVSGFTTIQIQGAPQTPWNMVFDSVAWRPNQMVSTSAPLPSGQSGAEITSSNGINIGDVAGGWSTQGSLIVRFRFTAASDDTGAAPSVTTILATGLSASAATVRGDITPNKQDTNYWFEYGTTSSLGQRTATQSLTQSLTSKQSVSALISQLSANTTYYYRVVGENNKGRTTGSILSFTTTGANGDTTAQPSVSTQAASATSISGAQLHGQINANNLATTYWFEYGTDQTLGSRTAVQGAGTGSQTNDVSTSISGLSANTTYYFRAVAQNSKGRTYGNVMSFITTTGGGDTTTAPIAQTIAADTITSTSARLNGSVNPGSLTTTYWFEYGTDQTLGSRSATQSTNGSVVQAISGSISGLVANTTYYFRAVAQNSKGTSYGSILNFSTTNGNGGNSKPTVTTQNATNITQTNATLAGYIHPNGLTSTYWFEYGTTQSLGQITTSQNINAAQNVTANISGLSAGTVYYFRVVAENTMGRSQGTVLSFTTTTGGGDTTTAPIAQTIAADTITSTSARLNGSVNPGSLTTTYWFEYGTDQTLGSRSATQNGGSGSQTNPIYTNISGLSANTTYYFRVASQNSKGRVYGNVLSFITTVSGGISAPTVTTQNATNITQTNATLAGYIHPNGLTSTYWFEYGADSSLGQKTASQTLSTAQNVTANISGLSAGTVYYFRVVAENTRGRSQGTVLSFTTTSSGGGGGGGGGGSSAGGPLVNTDNASAISLTGATIYGSMFTNGYAGYAWFEYGLTKDAMDAKTNEKSIQNSQNFVPFSVELSGLQTGKTYYYRAAARNQVNTSYGNILTFNTFGTQASGKLATVLTKAPTFISQNSALLNATVNPNGITNTTAWFEYGTSAGLGSRTTAQQIGNGTNDAQTSYALTRLTPGTTYFYRVVAQNSYGTVYGYILAVQTQSGGQTFTGNTITTVNTTSFTNTTTGGSSCLIVVPSIAPQNINAGEAYTYTLTYRNGCTYPLTNSFLKIIAPDETDIQLVSSDRGVKEQNVNEVTYDLGTVLSGDQGSVTIQGEVSTGVNKGDILIFSSVFNFTDSKNRPQSVSSYLTAETLSGRTLTASIFDAFQGLFGSWWFSLLLLLIIIFLIYWIFFKKKEEEVVEEDIDVLKA